MGLKWLITGGCGFIGRNLVKNLMEEKGHYVRVIDNLSVGTKDDLAKVCEFSDVKILPSSRMISNFSSKVDLVEGDILDAELAFDVARDMDVIVHLAANTGVAPSVENPRMDCHTNVIGTLNYLESARNNHISRFVFASSGAPAGECDPPIHEELPPHPVSPYGASKLAGEGYCSAYFNTFKINTVALRFGNVYGPLSGHKDSVVAKFIKKILDGEQLKIYGDGSQTRDFIFIDDLIRAIRASAVNKDIGGEIFQIATSSETTVNELVEILSDLFSQKSVGDIEILNTGKRLGDVMRNFSDTTKALEKLKWQSETGLKDGLNKTIEWFFKNRQAD